jgi:glutamate synthase domain-containing protein 3
MTGGVVVVLGPTGFNLGAGMTGGVCYVHDPAATILARINTQLVEARRLEGGDLDEVLALVMTHADVTGSQRARTLLDDWDRTAQGLWRIAPRGRLSRFERSDRGVGTSV